MLVIQRFRVAAAEEAAFRVAAEDALAVLSEQHGYVAGNLGRNVDDPALWVIQTTWEGPGAYRRALSSYDVKLRAWQLLGRALDEPSAYEVARPGRALNEPRPRGG
jgi:hypothetical protein